MSDERGSLSDNAGFNTKDPASERSLDVEREPMPASAPEVDSDLQDAPPARAGSIGEKDEKPTESGGNDNPVHHTGHIPPPVTANRE